MTIVNIHEAKTHLSRLLAAVERGDEIVIARAGKPIARLCAVDTPSSRRVLGRDAGTFIVPDAFDAPLPDDVLAAFHR